MAQTTTEPIEDAVVISRSEYNGLLQAMREVCELDAGGVDNWVGYDEIDWTYVRTGKREGEEQDD